MFFKRGTDLSLTRKEAPESEEVILVVKQAVWPPSCFIRTRAWSVRNALEELERIILVVVCPMDTQGCSVHEWPVLAHHPAKSMTSSDRRKCEVVSSSSHRYPGSPVPDQGSCQEPLSKHHTPDWTQWRGSQLRCASKQQGSRHLLQEELFCVAVVALGRSWQQLIQSCLKLWLLHKKQ